MPGRIAHLCRESVFRVFNSYAFHQHQFQFHERAESAFELVDADWLPRDRPDNHREDSGWHYDYDSGQQYGGFFAAVFGRDRRHESWNHVAFGGARHGGSVGCKKMMYVRTDPRIALVIETASPVPARGSGIAIPSERRQRPSTPNVAAPGHYRRYQRSGGMGDTSAQEVQQVGGIVTPVVSAASASAVGAALGITSAALSATVVGAAFAGVLIGVEAILNSGCGKTCIETSQWANQAEPILQQNCDTYFAQSPRTTVDQQSALLLFQATWNQLVQLCSQAGLGTAGQDCISDRQAGACKWKATADSPWPGGPAAGTCWNWWNAYHDPIANDTDVVASTPSQVAESAVTWVSTSTGIPAWMLAVAAVVILGVAL